MDRFKGSRFSLGLKVTCFMSALTGGSITKTPKTENATTMAFIFGFYFVAFILFNYFNYLKAKLKIHSYLGGTA